MTISLSTDGPADIAIVGGGLAGGLIALALAERRPETRVALIEAGSHIGGNHLWSFFDGDVAAGDLPLVAPLVCHRWDAYDIRFPAHARTLHTAYQSIESERLDAVVRARLAPESIVTGRPVVQVDPAGVVLAGGTRIAARAVIDARGAGNLSLLACGWQKFVGKELRLAGPHGLDRPIVMDASVPQIDGYRFVYVLPFGPDRLFVEDTYYSDTPDLDGAALKQRIARYAHDQGWAIAEVVRTEYGALPVTLGGDFERYWHSSSPGIAKVGARAGLFHPTTGYSLPDAVRTAGLIAGIDTPTTAGLHAALHDHARRRWQERGFYRLLDRMLFRAAEPMQRYRVLERFYRLNPGLIGRFYGGRSTLADKARILVGKPPVPFFRALAQVLEKRT